MINFLYKYSLASVISFLFSNLLFYFFEKFFHPSISSLITIIIIFNFNTFILFKLDLFKKNKKNYYNLLTLSVSFRIFEYLFFNLLFLIILTNLKSNYIFLITLIVSYLVKLFVYYYYSKSKKY